MNSVQRDKEKNRIKVVPLEMLHFHVKKLTTQSFLVLSKQNEKLFYVMFPKRALWELRTFLRYKIFPKKLLHDTITVPSLLKINTHTLNEHSLQQAHIQHVTL